MTLSINFRRQTATYSPEFVAGLVLKQGYAGNPNPEVIGYARVSRDDQNLDMQLAALEKAGATRIFAEKISAINAKRPQWHLLRKHLRPGDTLYFYAYNRISRRLKELLDFVDWCKAKKITLKSTSEPHINPLTTNGRMVLSVTGAVDENELGRISDRTRDGMQTRMAAGQQMGRPVLATKAKIKEMKRMRKAKVPAKDIARRLKLSLSAVYANWK